MAIPTGELERRAMPSKHWFVFCAFLSGDILFASPSRAEQANSRHEVSLRLAAAPRALYSIEGFSDRDTPYIDVQGKYLFRVVGGPSGGLAIGPALNVGPMGAGATLGIAVGGTIVDGFYLGVRGGYGVTTAFDPNVPATLGRRAEIGINGFFTIVGRLDLGFDVGAVRDLYPQTPQLGYENYVLAIPVSLVGRVRL